MIQCGKVFLIEYIISSTVTLNQTVGRNITNEHKVQLIFNY